ncbi:hypothetical protein LINGRAHAP2_LOCUS23837, partial [Linum grandiflorum]
ELRAPTFPQRKRGPKQTKRRKEAWELETTKVDKNGKKYTALSKKGQVSKCSICSQTGHNRRRHYREDAEPSEPAAAPASPPAATPSTAATNPSNFMPNPATNQRRKLKVTR